MIDRPHTTEDAFEVETPSGRSKPATEDEAGGQVSTTSKNRKDELLEADLGNTFPASGPVTKKHIT